MAGPGKARQGKARRGKVSTAIINSAESLSRLIGDIRQQWNEHKFLRVTVKTGKARSLDQNALSHLWYEQIANELREDSALGVKAYCKLHFGVPILRVEEEEFRAFYDAGCRALPYEQKLKAMRFLPVTSIMTKEQLTQYCDAMQEHYRCRGVWLETL